MTRLQDRDRLSLCLIDGPTIIPEKKNTWHTPYTTTWPYIYMQYIMCVFLIQATSSGTDGT